MSLLTIGTFLLGFGGALLIYRAGMKEGVRLTFLFLEAKMKEEAEKARLKAVADLYGKSGQS